MKTPLLRGVRALALATLLVAGAAALSCSKEDSRGQLTVVIQTDLAMPKDVNYVRLEVRNDGLPLGTDNPPPLHRNDYPINPADPPDVRVTIPATFAVYNDSAHPAPVAVRVTAGHDGTPRVLRDAITAVPGDRNAMLRMYLQWLSDGSAVPPPAGAPDPRAATNACPDGQTNIAGICTDAHVDVATLPDFNPVLVYGGPSPSSGVGFDVLSCFAAPQLVTPDSACSFSLPPGSTASSFNVGIELPPGSDGVCNDTHCVVALDRQDSLVGPGVGWSVVAGRVQLPPGVCSRIAAVPSAHVVVTSACQTKTQATPSCGPPSAATDCSIHGTQDGAVPSDADVVSKPLSAQALALGEGHTCVRAQTSQTQVVCWGSNGALQTGSPTATLVSQSSPYTSMLSAPVTALAAGADATCVIAGGIYCWGSNASGQLGTTPTSTFTGMPTAVPTINDPVGPTVIAMSRAGIVSHACVSNGQNVRCWGDNSRLQLGVAGPNGLAPSLQLAATTLALGDRFTCALDAGGIVRCWGDNTYGQVTGTPTPNVGQAYMPGTGPLVGGRSLGVVAGKDFACSLAMTDQSVHCWGNGASGAASGTKIGTAVANLVIPLGGPVKQIAAGTDFGCAIMQDSLDGVRCWGDNTYGQLGITDATMTQSHPTLPIAGPYQEILAGGQRACVRSATQAACWGSNQDGEIKDPASPQPVTPTSVTYSGF